MYIPPHADLQLLQNTLSHPVSENIKVLTSAAVLLLLTTDVAPKPYLKNIVDQPFGNRFTREELSQPFSTPLTYNHFVPPPLVSELEKKDHLVHTCGRVRHTITLKRKRYVCGVSQKSMEWSELYNRDIYIFKSIRK
jgi:hypothetical protein